MTPVATHILVAKLNQLVALKILHAAKLNQLVDLNRAAVALRAAAYSAENLTATLAKHLPVADVAKLNQLAVAKHLAVASKAADCSIGTPTAVDALNQSVVAKHRLAVTAKSHRVTAAVTHVAKSDADCYRNCSVAEAA